MNNISPVPLLLALFVVLLYVIGYLLRIRRREQMKKLAHNLGLAFLDWDLPGDFPTNFVDGIRTWDNAHHAIAGMDGDTKLLAFEAQFGFGNRGLNETIVAVRSPHFHNLTAEAEKLLRITVVDGWRIARCRSRRLMRPSTIERAWKLLS